jgi:hypothetical protein
MENDKFILKFNDMDCWIADWEGDPDRTLVRTSAKQYPSIAKAESEAKKINKRNSHRKFALVVELM